MNPFAYPQIMLTINCYDIYFRNRCLGFKKKNFTFIFKSLNCKSNAHLNLLFAVVLFVQTCSIHCWLALITNIDDYSVDF